jgi:hypothetical protein
MECGRVGSPYLGSLPCENEVSSVLTRRLAFTVTYGNEFRMSINKLCSFEMRIHEPSASVFHST